MKTVDIMAKVMRQIGLSSAQATSDAESYMAKWGMFGKAIRKMAVLADKNWLWIHFGCDQSDICPMVEVMLRNTSVTYLDEECGEEFIIPVRIPLGIAIKVAEEGGLDAFHRRPYSDYCYRMYSYNTIVAVANSHMTVRERNTGAAKARWKH